MVRAPDIHLDEADDDDRAVPKEKLTPMEEALQELAEEAIFQLKTFLIILYGCCVRFYSTVVDWEYI